MDCRAGRSGHERNPVYAGKHRGSFRRPNHGNEWRKSLNIDDFVHFKLLKIGGNSRVESGINAALTVALRRIALYEAEILHLVVQNAENPSVREGKTSVN